MMFIDDDFMVQAANHGYVFRSRSGEGPKHGWSNQPTSDEYTRNGHAEVEVRSRDANEQSLVYLPTHTTVVE
jgi:hypothetical protein